VGQSSSKIKLVGTRGKGWRETVKSESKGSNDKENWDRRPKTDPWGKLKVLILKPVTRRVGNLPLLPGSGWTGEFLQEFFRDES